MELRLSTEFRRVSDSILLQDANNYCKKKIYIEWHKASTSVLDIKKKSTGKEEGI